MNKKWQIYETDENKIQEISQKYNLNKLLSTILANRNGSENIITVLKTLPFVKSFSFKIIPPNYIKIGKS